MITLKRDLFLPFYFFLVVFFFSVELNSPIVFYGTQFFGITFLVILRFVFYPRVSIFKIFVLTFLFFLWQGLIYIQSLSTHYDLLFLNSQKSIFLFLSMYLIYDLIVAYFKEDSLLKAINFYILLLSIIVFFQFFGFYFLGLTNESLDFSILLGGEGSRSEYLDSLYRPTGLMPEPAIFVGVQISLLVLQFLIYKKNNIVRVVGLISILMSMSFAGILLVMLFGTLVYVDKIKNMLFYIVAILISSLYLSDVFVSRLDSISSGGDGSNNVKLDIINYFLSNSQYILFGYGNILSNKSTPVFFEGATDLTFFITPIGVFGIFFGLIIISLFFYWLLKSKYTLKERLLILLPLIKLTNPGVLFFSCFIFIILAIDKQRRKQ